MLVILFIQVAAWLLLLLLSAFFSSSEVAFFSLNRHQVQRIQETHPQVGQCIAKLLEHPTKLLSTILIGNTVVNIGVSVLGYRLLEGMGVGFSIFCMTGILLIFGEFAPKRMAILWPEKTSSYYASTLAGMMRVLAPLRVGLEKITSLLSGYFQPRKHDISSEEYQSLVDISEESGLLDQHEHSMLKAILRLEGRLASEVMTPRVDIEGINLNDERGQILQYAENSKTRFLVVYRDDLDHITGLLDVRAFLLDPKHNLRKHIFPPFFVPEQCTLDKLLTQFLAKKTRVAVVVDEYGGTAGIITQGDIFEEITGELGDEYKGAHVFEELTPTAWLLDGNLSIEEVNQRTGLHLKVENSERLAGWIMEHAERIPEVGEIVQTEECKAMVRKMRHQRILLVLIEKIKSNEDGE